MLEFLHNFLDTIAEIIRSLGYWGIGIGMMIESACIPLPSEVVLPIGGMLVADGTINMLGANIAVAVGSMIGSLGAYAVGYYGGRPFILKYGKYFFVKEKHFYHAENTFNKYGVAAVFFGRLLPIIRTFISLPAGIARMNIFKFMAFSLIGMIPWNFLLIYLGYKFGENYDEIVGPIYHRFEYFIAGVIVLIIIYFAARHFLKTKKNKAA